VLRIKLRVHHADGAITSCTQECEPRECLDYLDRMLQAHAGTEVDATIVPCTEEAADAIGEYDVRRWIRTGVRTLRFEPAAPEVSGRMRQAIGQLQSWADEQSAMAMHRGVPASLRPAPLPLPLLQLPSTYERSLPEAELTPEGRVQLHLEAAALATVACALATRRTLAYMLGAAGWAQPIVHDALERWRRKRRLRDYHAPVGCGQESRKTR
jgi:hypothetical protein